MATVLDLHLKGVDVAMFIGKEDKGPLIEPFGELDAQPHTEQVETISAQTVYSGVYALFLLLIGEQPATTTSRGSWP